MTREVDVVIPMRDGCALRADVYRPAEGGPFPVLLMRQPYGKELASTGTYAHPAWYARHGFVVVVQDVRGRGRSDGEFTPFVDEANDGFDTVEWCARLPGTIPRVGMYGFSYQGATQLLTAGTPSSHLAAISPAMCASDFFDGWTYQGGAFSLAFAATWALQLAIESAVRRGDEQSANQLAQALSAPRAMLQRLPLADLPLPRESPFFDWLAHPTYDGFWRGLSAKASSVPGLHVAGWFDVFSSASLGVYTASSTDKRLVIGPWQHLPWSRVVAGIDHGADASPAFVDDLQVAWFKRWLADDTTDDLGSPVWAFVSGSNTWRDFESWPPPSSTEHVLFLDSRGRANSLDGDGRLVASAPSGEVADIFVHDPQAPVPSVGGGAEFYGSEIGPFDLRPIQSRNDVLVYTSTPLQEPLTVVGEPLLSLWLATSGSDADVVAHVSEVFADGRTRAVSHGVLRARFRHSFEAPMALEPDMPECLDVRLRPVGHEFQAGSRVRLDIAGSSFPMIDRNPGLILPPAEVRRSDLRRTTNAVLHGADRPARLRLPTIA